MNNLISEVYNMVEELTLEDLPYVGQVGLELINEAFCPYFGTGEEERFGEFTIINNDIYFRYHDNGEVEEVSTFNLKWPSRSLLGEYLEANKIVLDK